MPRFYVTMTWDDWPEGGSFGTVVEANDHYEAEATCRAEMAASRANERDEDETADEAETRILSELGDEWYVVDCFDLDEFIVNHATSAQKAAADLLAALEALVAEHDAPKYGTREKRVAEWQAARAAIAKAKTPILTDTTGVAVNARRIPMPNGTNDFVAPALVASD